jgi:hypothetical protein
MARCIAVSHTFAAIRTTIGIMMASTAAAGKSMEFCLVLA